MSEEKEGSEKSSATMKKSGSSDADWGLIFLFGLIFALIGGALASAYFWPYTATRDPSPGMVVATFNAKRATHDIPGLRLESSGDNVMYLVVNDGVNLYLFPLPDGTEIRAGKQSRLAQEPIQTVRGPAKKWVLILPPKPATPGRQ